MQINNSKNNNMSTTNNITFNSEWQRRENLVMDINFRKIAIKMAKEIGITAKEWNENKAVLLLYFANEFCAIENQINKNK